MPDSPMTSDAIDGPGGAVAPTDAATAPGVPLPPDEGAGPVQRADSAARTADAGQSDGARAAGDGGSVEAPDEEGSAGEDTVSFADLGLPDELLQAVTDMGFVAPTPIQAEAIPPLLDLRDVVGIAQTGTGKTAAFGLPLLAIADADEKAVQALVLAPTRELAMQSAAAIEDFAARTAELVVVPVYGGSPYGPQIGALKRGAQVVVGTPGRVIDLIEKGALDLSGVRMLVLDEADEMLRMGFAEDVETIASSVPDDRLTALFSATMPPAIEKVAREHLKDPVKVAVSEESSTVDTIHQTYAVVPYKHKIGALSRVLATRAQHIAAGQEDADAAIVFVRTRVDVEEVSLELSGRGFRAAGISGDVAQTERERMVERLKSGSLDVLVATDVAARGLDVERISLVVNFDVPREPEAYVHRIGRTGRAGRQGRSLTFFTPREHTRLRRIEKLTGTPMEEVAIPSPAAVSEFRARRLLEGVGARVERGRLGMYRELLEQMAASLDVEDVAAALIAQAVGDDGPAPRAESGHRGRGRARREEELDESGEFVGASFEAGRDKDKPLKGGRDGARRRGGGRAVAGPGTRYRVEVGRKDRVKPGSIVGAIAGEGGIDGRDIGHIDIFPTFSLVDITADLSAEQLSRISKGYVSGRQLRIRVDEGPGRRDRFERGGSERPSRGERRSGRGERFDREDSRPGRDDRFDRGDRGGRSDRFDREDSRPGRGGRFGEDGRGGWHRSVRTERWERDIKKRRARDDFDAKESGRGFGHKDRRDEGRGRNDDARRFGKRRYED
ncbi:DEAD/DEAH box helicase [Schaalia georgiae]|uniref:DEAD/DEAH box helicase n=1 Tax=Schaalia georgiae TaxID=52768 RepID=UPI0003FC373C|nr:DEAD/DEAH box helicase [Schaalia georgiae]